ncbi:hypothetical protein XENTR_v10020950 [Xenopus tropicalis]|nr:hypothetical protein XENTR_v10020950 [Xenopus tropicalis]
MLSKLHANTLISHLKVTNRALSHWSQDFKTEWEEQRQQWRKNTLSPFLLPAQRIAISVTDRYLPNRFTP